MLVKSMKYLKLNIIYENKRHVLKTYAVKNGGPPIIGRFKLPVFKFYLFQISKVYVQSIMKFLKGNWEHKLRVKLH